MMLHAQRLAILAGGALVSMTLGACAKDSSAKTSSEAPAKVADSVASVLATIGDEKIGLSDLRERVGVQLDQLDMQYRRARDKLIGAALDSVLRDRLLQAESKK